MITREMEAALGAECPVPAVYSVSISTGFSRSNLDAYQLFDMRYLFCELMQAIINPHILFAEV